jgi:pyruvate formate lyase activating enzyme
MIKGKIKQIETMGLVDGPGVRVVVFMQGCSLRCLFCHNPEMWNFDGGNSYSPEELLRIILKYKSYFGDEGGVTFSGGEPLMQPEFLLEILKLCKRENINTCLDTAGVGNEKLIDEILSYTDLVIFDIKALTDEKYKEMTGGSINTSIKFLRKCEKLNKSLWIRSVIVPGMNDTGYYIKALADFIKPLRNIEKVELLPYHTMGISKYKDLNIDYPLRDIKAMNIDKCKELEQLLISLISAKNN